MAITARQLQFVPIVTGDQSLNRVQQSLQAPINEMAGHWIFRSRMVTGVSLSSGAVTQIKHGLGRTPQGWLIVDVDTWAADCFAYRDDSAVTQPQFYLGIYFSGGVSPVASFLVW